MTTNRIITKKHSQSRTSQPPKVLHLEKETNRKNKPAKEDYAEVMKYYKPTLHTGI
jgi:hypothetical protein